MNKHETINEEMYVKELVENCKLSMDEYLLLPEDEKLEYCHMRFNSFVDIKVGEKSPKRGYMHPNFFNYFHKCGCKVVNFDFGIECFVITKIKDLEFVSNKDAKERLYKYLLVIVQERIKVQNYINELYSEDINSLIFDKIPADVQKEMILISLSHFLEGKKQLFNTYINDCYLNTLKDLGYGLVDSNSKFSKIYKLDRN